MKWFPEDDQISLDISELNFAKKSRGKKPNLNSAKIVPERLTRRHCVSKVAEIFDIVGRITPITAAVKLDLHQLVHRGLDRDDAIPENLRPIWSLHFKMMKEIPAIKYQRAVIPQDAANLDINTVETGDASQSIACNAIYVRFKRRNGSYSCQLIFGRSKLVPEGKSQSRAELLAATINTHTGEVVKRALYKYHKKSVKLTDSQIVLYWISSINKPWVRNRIIEIRRFSNPDEWRYVQSKLMVADIGTRKGARLEDVNPQSSWINSLPWMTSSEDKFPTKSVNQIKLSNSEIEVVTKEQLLNHGICDVFENSTTYKSVYISAESDKKCIPEEVRKMYNFSNYIIDPNCYKFKMVINTFSLVIQFIQIVFNKMKLRKASTSRPLMENSSAIREAENYYFRKTTEEIKKYVDENKYKKIFHGTRWNIILCWSYSTK